MKATKSIGARSIAPMKRSSARRHRRLGSDIIAERPPADVDADSRSVARVIHGDEENTDEGTVY